MSHRPGSTGMHHGIMGSKSLAWMVAAVGLTAGIADAQSSAPPSNLSLDQAVQQVQQREGGKVLSAEPRHIGRRVEYRIKVLTPEGHVRVLAVPSDAGRPPAAAQSSNRKSPNGGSNKKEKH
jgi:hypothetical protein